MLLLYSFRVLLLSYVLLHRLLHVIYRTSQLHLYCNFATLSVAGDFVYAFKNLEITNPHSIAAKMLPDDE